MTPEQQLLEQTAQLAQFAERFETLGRRLRALELAVGEPNFGVGTFSGTTSAASAFTVTHGLPFTPTSVIVQPATPNGGSPSDRFVSANVTAVGSTSFVIGRCVAQDGSLLASTAVTGYWVAFR